MSPRPDVSEHRKNQILQAARKVFTQQGFQNARMDDIVAESGLSKGALYWYFKSKDDIIFGIVDSLLDRELEHLRVLRQADAPAAERLADFIDLTIDDFLKLEGLQPILFEILALASRRKTVRLMIRHYFRSYREVLETIIQQGLDWPIAGQVIDHGPENL